MTDEDLDLKTSLDFRETEPPNNRSLHITHNYPTSMYLAILKLTVSKDMYANLLGEEVGSIKAKEPDHPLMEIQTKVNGMKTFTQWEDIPGEPGYRRGIGEQIEEFNLETRFKLQNHTYIEEAKKTLIVGQLMGEGYEVKSGERGNGYRYLTIGRNGREFELGLGFSSPESEILFYRNQIEKNKDKYPDSVRWNERHIESIISEKDESSLSLEIKNSHPDHSPSGIPIESKEQVTEYFEESKNLTEIVATILTKELGKGGNFEKLEMGWKPKTIAEAIWHENGKVSKIEDLESIPLVELNTSMLRVIQSLKDEKNSPDLFDKNGMNPEANKILTLIEGYFTEKYGKIDPSVFTKLSERDRVLLALGLSLKSIGGAIWVEKYGSFIPDCAAGFAGITLQRYGESSRDRYEFYLQQERKYKYRKDTVEAADFLLLHTAFDDQEDKLTRYEKIQSANLEAARDWIVGELEPAKKGNYSPEDVQKINQLLLKGLVPERAEGMFRQTKSAKIEGRIGMTEPEDINRNLSYLLENTGKYISSTEGTPLSIEEEEVLRKIVQKWAYFDAIHPMEEGNGRTGTLLFESWYRLLFGSEKHFISERTETIDLSGVMSGALKGDSDIDFWYMSDEANSLKEMNVTPFFNYVKSHLV